MAQGLSPYIELFGFPGSGKTALAHSLASAIAGEGLHVLGRSNVRTWLARQGRARKAVMAVRRASTFLSDARIYNRSVVGHTPKRSCWRMAVKGAMLRAYLDQFRRECHCDLVVLDEWSMQWFWAMSLLSRASETNPIREQVRNYLRRDAPSLTVYLEAQPEVASRRVHARVGENTVFDHRPVEEVEHCLKESAESMRTIIDSVRDEGCPFMNVDALASTETNARRIVMKAADLGLLGKA